MTQASVFGPCEYMQMYVFEARVFRSLMLVRAVVDL